MDTASDPVCPSCRAAWSYDFLTDELTHTFRTKAYKAHREKVLLDRERARLPETQEDAERYKAAVEYVKPINEEMKKTRNEIYETPEFKAYTTIKAAFEAKRRSFTGGYAEFWNWLRSPEGQTARTDMETGYHAFNKASKPFHRKIQKLSTREYQTQSRLVEQHGTLPPPLRQRGVTGVAGGVAGAAENAIENAIEEPKERKQFIAKCPASECEGFLSTAWKCGLCHVHVCKECREIKQTDVEHVCNPDTIMSVRAIIKDSKPCPKCGTMISKISGCDQMWCIDCKTAFSWNTGKIETNVIHNPHYFDWVRQTGQALQIQGHPGMGCGIHTLARDLSHGSPATDSLRRNIVEFIRSINHTRWNVPRYDRYAQDMQEDLRTYRVRRLVREIDDDAWKVWLQRKEKEHNKLRSRTQLLEMFVQAGTDTVGQLQTDRLDITVARVHDECKKLMEFVKQEETKIIKKYGCVPLDIPNPWMLELTANK